MKEVIDAICATWQLTVALIAVTVFAFAENLAHGSALGKKHLIMLLPVVTIPFYMVLPYHYLRFLFMGHYILFIGTIVWFKGYRMLALMVGTLILWCPMCLMVYVVDR